MVRAALRDLQWRRLRFVIAVAGTALVFAVSLLLSGVSASFGREADRMLSSVGADAWLVRDGVPGPFTSFVPLRASWATQFKSPDIEQVDPMLVVHQTTRRLAKSGRPPAGEAFKDITLFGVRPGGLGSPIVHDGHSVRQGTDAVVDERLGYRIGQQLSVGTQIFTVVGRTRHATLFAGLANVYVDISSAQHLFAGSGDGDVANALVVRGRLRPPVFVLDGIGSVPLRMLTSADVKADVLRPLANARKTIDQVRSMLWVIAGCIVASIVYVTALDRSRDFAVFKAAGTSNGAILLGLLVQSVVLAATAGLLAVALALVLAPAFPVPVAVPARAFVLLGLLAVAVGAVASLAGLRRVVRTDPAAAFAGP
jgi:putative ABC transport system permease protein